MNSFKAASHQPRPMSQDLFKMLDDELMQPGAKWSEVYPKVMKMRKEKKKAKKAMLAVTKLIQKPAKPAISEKAAEHRARFKRSLRTPGPSPTKPDQSQREIEEVEAEMVKRIAEFEKSMKFDMFGNPKQFATLSTMTNATILPDDVHLMATVFSTIHYSTGTFGILANLFVFYCIFFKSQNSIREYRILLANSALTDLICTAALLFLQPRLIPHKFVFIYIAEGPSKYFGPQVSYYAYCVVLNMIFYTFFSFPFSFGYRYYVLVRHPPTQQRLIAICLGLYSIAFCQLVLFVNSQSPTEHIRRYVVENVPEVDITDEVVSGNDGARDPLTWITLFLITVPMFPIYVVVIVIRRRVHRLLDGASYSERTKQAHRSLMQALTVHAALPVCFIFPPIIIYACYHLVPCLRFHATEFLVYTMFAWTHAVNPVITIYFVRPYNRAARQVLYCFRHLSSKPLKSETSVYPSSISYAKKA